MERKELKEKRIGVLMGGKSAERDVSLMSGKAIVEALQGLGYPAIPIEADEALPQRLRDQKIEVAFIALHGRLGEDGAVQGLLEMMRLPYTGSGVLASALSMHKALSRKLFLHHGLPVPRCLVLKKGDPLPSSLPFSLPVVVKPCQEGSSVGITIVSQGEEIPAATEKAFAYGPEILVEGYIPGQEIQVGILEGEALGAIEIVPKVSFYNYQAKYTEGLAEHFFPARIPQKEYERALDLGLQAHRLLGCEGATRVDLLYQSPGQWVVLEVNTLPGMTPLSLLPEIARGVGLSFPMLVDRILFGARLKIQIPEANEGLGT